MAPSTDLGPPHVPHQIDAARQQDPPVVGRLALDEELLAGRERPPRCPRRAAPPAPCHRARRTARAGAARRGVITSWPGSGAPGRPTWRLRPRPTPPASSSPAARRRPRRRPGTLVSSANGGRLSGHDSAYQGASRSWPVTTKPLSSRHHLGPEPVGARRRTDEHEQPARHHLLLGTGVAVGHREPLQVAVAARRLRPRCAAAPRRSAPPGSARRGRATWCPRASRRARAAPRVFA